MVSLQGKRSQNSGAGIQNKGRFFFRILAPESWLLLNEIPLLHFKI
jgi:hypothetical protein